MAMRADAADRIAEDPVSNVLKWILLAVAVGTFALLGWTTVLTYEAAPPFPDRFVSADGTLLMSAADIQAGKAGFQKADLMDYGSLYGMGSYFGEDYTASNLVRLATLTEDNIAKAKTGKALSDLTAEEQASVKAAMQVELQGIDLTKQIATVPDAVCRGDHDAARRDRAVAAPSRLRQGLDPGLQPRCSRAPQQTADFLIYSSLTTVARRPGTTASWTQNWPFEPLVGNTPTTSTFRWTWISFCFTFFAFGAVLFIYERYLNDPDQAPMDPVLAKFGPLTAEPAADRKIFPRGRGRAPAANPRRFDHGPLLLRIGRASTGSRSTASCRSISCATSISSRRSSGSAFPGSARPCFWRRRSAAASRRDRAFSSMSCSG